MACILKAPTSDSKGIVTFTTPKRDQFILEDSQLQEKQVCTITPMISTLILS